MSKRLCALALAAVFAFGAADAAEKVRVGLAAPGYTPYAAVQAAEELGYYKAKGLEVEITTYRGGGAAQEALAAGAADVISFFPPGVALAIQKGVKQKIVAAGAGITPRGWYILVPKDSPIRSLKDLGGKKIGITSKGATTDFFALWGAKQGGVTAQVVPLGGAGVITALKANQVDAAVLWPNLSYKAMLQDGARPLADLGAIMEPNVPESWVASQDMIDKRPNVLRGFLQAVMKSAAYMQKNEAFSIAFVKKYTGESDDRVAKMAYDTVVKNFGTDGVLKPEWLRASIALAALAGPAEMPKIEDIYTDKFFPVKFD